MPFTLCPIGESDAGHDGGYNLVFARSAARKVAETFEIKRVGLNYHFVSQRASQAVFLARLLARIARLAFPIPISLDFVGLQTSCMYNKTRPILSRRGGILCNIEREKLGEKFSKSNLAPELTPDTQSNLRKL